MNKFKLPIGDWSKDGHNQCDYFIVKSNIPFKEIVTIYMAMDEEYKVSEQCAEYKNYCLTEDFIKFIKTKDLDPDEYIMDDEGGVTSRSMATLIIDFLMKFDSKLELSIVEDVGMPMLCNWAVKKGYLSLPGYGLFD